MQRTFADSPATRQPAPMHIVLNGWFWGQMATGSGQYLHHLLQQLPAVAAGRRYTLIAAQAPTDNALPPAGWQVHRASTPFDRLSPNLAKVWFEQISFPGLCRRLAADLVLVPYWGSPWRQPCAVVVTIHDLIPLLLPAYRGGVLQRAYTRLVALTARRAAAILTDSQASRRDIIAHLGVPVGDVHAIPLAVDERYRPVTDGAELARVRRAYRLPQRFILYLGGFDVRKNVPLLVRAYAGLLRRVGPGPEPPRLVIAGRLPAADSSFTPDPRRVVAEEGIEDWVRFVGWVAEADKPALYSLATLFAFPSAYEGFGLPAVEALCCGAPVVTCNRSSLPEVASGAVLVEPGDVAALAAALAQALANPPSMAGWRRTWTDVATETWRVLAETAQG